MKAIAKTVRGENLAKQMEKNSARRQSGNEKPMISAFSRKTIKLLINADFTKAGDE